MAPAFAAVPALSAPPRAGQFARRYRSLDSDGANWLASFADARSDIPPSHKHVDDRLLADLVGTNGGRSNTVSSRPLAW